MIKKNSLKEHHRIDLQLQRIAITLENQIKTFERHTKDEMDKLTEVKLQLEKIDSKVTKLSWKVAGVSASVAILVTLIIQIIF